MKKYIVYLMMLVVTCRTGATPMVADELDRVFVYLNSKLVGTWRADGGQVVHIDKIANGDTITFRARTDLGGLVNSSIDIKDNLGVPIDNIQSPSSTESEAIFVYIVHLNKIDTAKVMSLQVSLNVDPARNLPPPVIASISVIKK